MYRSTRVCLRSTVDDGTAVHEGFPVLLVAREDLGLGSLDLLAPGGRLGEETHLDDGQRVARGRDGLDRAAALGAETAERVVAAVRGVVAVCIRGEGGLVGGKERSGEEEGGREERTGFRLARDLDMLLGEQGYQREDCEGTQGGCCQSSA